MNWIKKLFEKKPFEKKPQIIYQSKLDTTEPLGYMDIQIGDAFEGAACGNWFTDQICQSMEDDFVYGTTRLAVFRKNMIRPINKMDQPIRVEKFYV